MLRRIWSQMYARKSVFSFNIRQCGCHQYFIQKVPGEPHHRWANCHTITSVRYAWDFKVPQELFFQQKRCFWGVDVAFNRVDEERVRLAGPDRAAAEWVLRNGGAIKWTTSSNQLKDYNLLPSTQFEIYKLEELDLSSTDVIGIGFEHLKDLHHVKKIKIHDVKTLGDDGLSYLSYVADTLTTLEISHCPMVTEKGLEHLVSLKKLKTLILHNLLEIRNLDAVISKLRQQMPGVTITTDHPQP